jgi:1,4-dihydroxy-2-naphthoate octaprenyltransferase
MNIFKAYILETRPQYLLLPPVLIFLGSAIALKPINGTNFSFSLAASLIAFAGLLLLHISVNSLNDYFDDRSGIDSRVKRSPFNGGAGIIQAGFLTRRQVLVFSLVCFTLAVPVGVYFLVQDGWGLMPVLVMGAVFVLLYTQALTRVGGGFGEIAAGLGLGTLPVLGAFYVQTVTWSAEAVYAAIPSGILVCNLLFLNEFPDVAADKYGKRKTLPIILGVKRAAILYTVLTVCVFLIVIGGCISRLMPWQCLLALGTLPLAIRACRGAMSVGNPVVLGSAMASNVMTVLLTQVLLGIGFLWAYLWA